MLEICMEQIRSLIRDYLVSFRVKSLKSMNTNEQGEQRTGGEGKRRSREQAEQRTGGTENRRGREHADRRTGGAENRWNRTGETENRRIGEKAQPFHARLFTEGYRKALIQHLLRYNS